MDPQIVVAELGIAGTLIAALASQWFARRGERDRRQHEDATRWLPDRFTVATELLTEASRVQRRIYDAAAWLRPAVPADRIERLGGQLTIFAVPPEGIPGVMSAEERDMIVDALPEIHAALERMEETISRVVVIGHQHEGEAARKRGSCDGSVGGLRV